MKKPRPATQAELAWISLIEQNYQWPFTELLLWEEGSTDPVRQIHQQFWQQDPDADSAKRQQVLQQLLEQYPHRHALQIHHGLCRGHHCEIIGLAENDNDAFAVLNYLVADKSFQGQKIQGYSRPLEHQVAFQFFLILQ